MEQDLIQIFEMVVAIVVAIVAYWQRRQKIDATNETLQVIAFYDPKDDSVTTPPASVPARSWKMDDETKRWVLVGTMPSTRQPSSSRLRGPKGNSSTTTS